MATAQQPQAGAQGGGGTTSDSKRAALGATFEAYKGLVKAIVFVCGVFVAGGVGTGIYMIVKGREVSDAIAVMATPFAGVLALVIVAASVISFAVKGNTLDSLKVRIVGILGGVLAVLVIGAFALVLKDKTTAVPDALTAAISAIVGGLLGVLTPAGPASGLTPAEAVQAKDAIKQNKLSGDGGF